MSPGGKAPVTRRIDGEAADHDRVCTVGVEDELLVVDPAGTPVPLGPEALEVAARRGEGQTVAERGRADAAAATLGARVAVVRAAGTATHGDRPMG